jgi:uncharacterized protein (TIGR02145 family)
MPHIGDKTMGTNNKEQTNPAPTYGRGWLALFTAILAIALAFTFNACSENPGEGGLPSSSGEVNSSSSGNDSSSSNENDSSSSSETDGTIGSLVYQGKTYKTVQIGTQTWMAENLNYAAEGSKCYSNYEPNCNVCGRLCDWATAMGFDDSCNASYCGDKIDNPHRGVCPEAWHILSDEDWDKLFRYVDGDNGTSSPYDSETAGKKLKATGVGWKNSMGDLSYINTDDFNFSAKPCGEYLYAPPYMSQFTSSGFFGLWWSTKEINNYDASYRYMHGESNGTSRDSRNKRNMFDIRCVKD